MPDLLDEALARLLGRPVYDALNKHLADGQRAEEERDGAYHERAHLLAWLATLHAPHAVLAPAVDIDDEDGWHLLFLNVAGRQLSWHIAPRDVGLFDHVERVDVADSRAQWDGHTTQEKYQRIRTLPWGEMRAAVRTPGSAEAAVERVREYLEARLDQVAVDPADLFNLLNQPKEQ